MQKVISTDKAPSAIGPYSQAIEINGMVYTSGVIPVIPATGEIAEGGVEAQAEQAFKNLCNLVEESGSKVENIVKTTVFIKEMNDFGKINEIYKKYFKEPFPARSCVEVACRAALPAAGLPRTPTAPASRTRPRGGTGGVRV